jgi:uncharacterized membrane protein
VVKRVPAGRKVTIAAIAGICVGFAAVPFLPWYVCPLLGYEVAAVVYLGWVWINVHRYDADQTRTHVNLEDPTATQADIALLAAAVASLVAVGLVLLNLSPGNVGRILQVTFSVASVVVSWALVHTIFTLRYAGIYYGVGPDGGIDFNQKEPPRYSDFAYLAFTIGMTFQVSDTELNNSDIRSQELRHGLLSYLFGTVIVALTINMVAGLSR